MLKHNDVIVFDGDSLTARRMGPSLNSWPYLRLSNWERQYPEMVDEWLFCNRPDLALTCKVAAIGGSTCKAMLERFDTMVRPHKPSWVVFTVGSNDNAQGVSTETFTAQLTDYVRRVQDLGGQVLYISGMKACPNLDTESARTLDARQSYYRNGMETVRSLQGHILDIGDTLKTKAEALAKLYPGHSVYSDGVHLNAIGNQIIATLVLEKLGVLTLTN